MPANVVKTERDEHLWNKAKRLGKGKGKNRWAYIMGIYKKMKGEKKEAALRFQNPIALKPMARINRLKRSLKGGWEIKKKEEEEKKKKGKKMSKKGALYKFAAKNKKKKGIVRKFLKGLKNLEKHRKKTDDYLAGKGRHPRTGARPRF